MPLLNFKKEFAPLVELGIEDPDHPEAKRTTIRARRRDGKDPKPGQTLYLYTGLRTKSARRLGVAPCAFSEPIAIEENGDVILGTKDFTRKAAEKLATRDGFTSFQDFMNFFQKTHGLPFYGIWIAW